MFLYVLLSFNLVWSNSSGVTNSFDQKVEALWQAVHLSYPYSDTMVSAYLKQRPPIQQQDSPARNIASEPSGQPDSLVMKDKIKAQWIKEIKARFSETEVEVLTKFFHSQTVRKMTDFSSSFWTREKIFPILQQSAPTP